MLKIINMLVQPKIINTHLSILIIKKTAYRSSQYQRKSKHLVNGNFKCIELKNEGKHKI